MASGLIEATKTTSGLGDMSAGLSYRLPALRSVGLQTVNIPLDTALVQSWLDNPSTNQGIQLINNNPGDSGRAELSQATLLRNNVGERRNWLAIELRGTESNRDAVGATVTVEAGGQKFTRLVSAGSGFASQQSARLYVGLGDKTQVDAVTVWLVAQLRYRRLSRGRLARDGARRDRPGDEVDDQKSGGDGQQPVHFISGFGPGDGPCR